MIIFNNYNFFTTPEYRLVIVTLALSLCTLQISSNSFILSPTFICLKKKKNQQKKIH